MEITSPRHLPVITTTPCHAYDHIFSWCGDVPIASWPSSEKGSPSPLKCNSTLPVPTSQIKFFFSRQLLAIRLLCGFQLTLKIFPLCSVKFKDNLPAGMSQIFTVWSCVIFYLLINAREIFLQQSKLTLPEGKKLWNLFPTPKEKRLIHAYWLKYGSYCNPATASR